MVQHIREFDGKYRKHVELSVFSNMLSIADRPNGALFQLLVLTYCLQWVEKQKLNRAAIKGA